MQEIDPSSAQFRINALKEQLAARIENIKDPEKLLAAKAKIETITKLSKELAALEAQTATAEEEQRKDAEALLTGKKPDLRHDDLDPSNKGQLDAALLEDDRKSRILAQDKEYQSILAMTTKAEVIDYLAAQFGIKEDARRQMEGLRFVALEKRKERVFEV